MECCTLPLAMDTSTRSRFLSPRLEEAADAEGEDDRQNANEERQPPAIDQPRQHVAAEFVGAERIIRRADVAKPADHRALVGVGQTQPWRQQRRGEDQHQHEGADHADLVA